MPQSRNGAVPYPLALTGTGAAGSKSPSRSSGPLLGDIIVCRSVVGAQRSLAVTGKWQPRELHYFVLNYVLRPGDVIEMHIRASQAGARAPRATAVTPCCARHGTWRLQRPRVQMAPTGGTCDV